jgi:hypothetical protein
MKRKMFLIAFLISLVLLAGCSGKEDKFKTLVRNYNENLSLALKRQDTELMTRFTTSREKIRINLYMEYLTKEQKTILDSKLKKISVGKPQLDGDTAKVMVQEEWSYSYLDVENRKEIKAPKNQAYQSTYYLVKNDKKEWVVDAVDIGQGNPNAGPYGTSDKAPQGATPSDAPGDKK